MGRIKFSLPNPIGKTFLFHERPAARATPGVFPRFDKMFCRDRAGRLHFLPFKPARRGRFGDEQTVPQNHRRNFRARERGKFAGQFFAPNHAAHSRKNIEQFPAFAAGNRLDVAINSFVRAAGNICAIPAMRALVMISLTHSSSLAGSKKKSSARNLGSILKFLDKF